MGGLDNSRKRWVVGLGVGLASVALVLSGYGVVALVLLAGVTAVAVARRGGPERRIRVERCLEAAELPHTCEVVWALIKPAEKSPILVPSIRHGHHVPGTPLGLGERQAFELVDGTSVVVEVVEYEPGRRAVTRQVSPPLAEQFRFVHSVEPTPGGCLYVTGYEIDVSAGQRVDRRAEQAWRLALREQSERIRHALAATDPRAASPNEP